VLRAHAHHAPDGWHVVGDAEAVDGGVTAGGRHQPSQHVDGRALAAAVMPEQARHLPLINGQAEVVHGSARGFLVNACSWETRSSACGAIETMGSAA